MRWFFSFGFVDDFATALLNEIAPQLPPPDSPHDKLKTSLKRGQKREAGLSLLHRRAVEFGRRERLNFIQKARFCKRLQDGLMRSGQRPELARSIAVGVIDELN